MGSGERRELPMMASVRNTVRIELGNEATRETKEGFGLEWICRRIMKDVCGLDMNQIFCLQDFTKVGFADVTLVSPRACSEFYAKCVEKREHEHLRGLKFRPLFGGEKVPLVIHMYNPYVEEDEIKIFLQRYCEEVSVGEKLVNTYGIWTGRRRFTVRFKTNVGVPGGLVYPPGNFSIGPHRGFLWFPGQPIQCWKCGGSGHSKEKCNVLKCRNCGKDGHVAASCSELKSCSLCGSPQHLYRQCPQRKTTYAGRVAATNNEERSGERDGRQQEQQEETNEMDVTMDDSTRKRSWAEEVEREGKRRAEENHMEAREVAMMDKESGEKEEAESSPGGVEDTDKNEDSEDADTSGWERKRGTRSSQKSKKAENVKWRGRMLATQTQITEWIRRLDEMQDKSKGIMIKCKEGVGCRVRNLKDIIEVCETVPDEEIKARMREGKDGGVAYDT